MRYSRPQSSGGSSAGGTGGWPAPRRSAVQDCWARAPGGCWLDGLGSDGWAGRYLLENLSVGLLGPLEVRRDGFPVVVPGGALSDSAGCAGVVGGPASEP